MDWFSPLEFFFSWYYSCLPSSKIGNISIWLVLLISLFFFFLKTQQLEHHFCQCSGFQKSIALRSKTHQNIASDLTHWNGELKTITNLFTFWSKNLKGFKTYKTQLTFKKWKFEIEIFAFLSTATDDIRVVHTFFSLRHLWTNHADWQGWSVRWRKAYKFWMSVGRRVITDTRYREDLIATWQSTNKGDLF